MKKMTNIILSTLMVFTMTIANAQSKKEQIEILTFSLDSLNQAVVSERQSFNTTLDSLNQVLSKNQQDFELEMDKSSITINNLNNQLSRLNSINDSINIQLNEIKEEKLILSQEFSTLSKRVDSLKQQITELTNNNSEYYIIEDPDGYSNLREAPSGNVLRKVYGGEKFEIIGEENSYKKVMFPDSSTGYIHNSRVVNFNVKVCQCLNSANELIKKDLDKDFSTGSETGFPDNWSPSYTERLVEIFRYNQCPIGCSFLSDPEWDGIDIKSEIQRCIE